jgi:hypothetical protein
LPDHIDAAAVVMAAAIAVLDVLRDVLVALVPLAVAVVGIRRRRHRGDQHGRREGTGQPTPVLERSVHPYLLQVRGRGDRSTGLAFQQVACHTALERVSQRFAARNAPVCRGGATGRARTLGGQDLV